MPDIFDTLEAEPAATPDVFDEIAPEKVDVFDEISDEPQPFKIIPQTIPRNQDELNVQNWETRKRAGFTEGPKWETFGETITTPLVNLAGRVNAQQVQDAGEVVSAKLADLMTGGKIDSQEILGERSNKPDTASQVIAGSQNVAGGLVNSFTSPLGIATLGQGALPKIAQRLISLGFAADMVHQLPESARAAGEASVNGDAQEKVEAYGGAGVNALMAALTAKHGLTPGKPVPMEKQAEIVAEINDFLEKQKPASENAKTPDIFDEIANESPAPKLPGAAMMEEIKGSAIPPKGITREVEGEVKTVEKPVGQNLSNQPAEPQTSNFKPETNPLATVGDAIGSKLDEIKALLQPKAEEPTIKESLTVSAPIETKPAEPLITPDAVKENLTPESAPISIGKENADRPGTAAIAAAETGAPRSRGAGEETGGLIKGSKAEAPAGYTSIFRSGDATEEGVKPFSSWSESKATARSYLDNPGFGGKTLREVSVPLASVLEADTTTRRGMQKFAQALGMDHEIGNDWFDNGYRYPWEESSKVKHALRESEFKWLRYKDDFPEGAETIIALKDVPEYFEQRRGGPVEDKTSETGVSQSQFRPDISISENVKLSSDPAPSKTIEQKLDALKIDTKGTVQAFGLLPEAWNRLIDLVKLGVKAGRKFNEAVDWAVAKVKQQFPEQKLDEESARSWLQENAADFTAEPKAGYSKPKGDLAEVAAEANKPKTESSWEETERQLDQAREELRLATRKAIETGDKPGDKAANRKAMNMATAKARSLDDALHENPEYLRHLYQLQADGIKRLRELKNEGAGTEDTRFKLQSTLEDVDARVRKFPAKMRNSVYEEMFGASDSALKEQSEKAVEPGELSERSEPPMDDEAELPEGRLQRQMALLPARVREIFSEAKKAKELIVGRIKRGENREAIAYTKDAADNRANVFGRQAANVVLHELNRAFGAEVTAREPRREMALTFAIESGGDKAALRDFEVELKGSEYRQRPWAKEAIDAIQYAKKHWERFQPVVETYRNLTDAQHAAENNSGIKTLHRPGGYVFHLQDVLEGWDLPEGGGGGGPSAPFKHQRDFPTYAAAIANGTMPRTLNAVDLLHRRMTLGRKLINYRAWTEALSDLTDPTSQTPLVRDVKIKVRQDGSHDVTAPIGYSVTNYAGQQFAIHKGYEGLFKDLTEPSAFARGTLRPVLMKTATTTKHLMLLFDTYHLGRLAFWNAMSRGNILPGNGFAYKKGLTLLDNSVADIQQMVKNGEIPAEWEADLLENKRQLNGLMKAGLNVGSARDNVYSDWIHKIPVTGKFNSWLFDSFQRGAMSEAAIIELARERKMFPKLSEPELMRKVAKDLNVRFGNLGSQGWLKSKTLQDLARMMFLAPQWNESLIRAEMGAAKQLFTAPYDSYKAGRPAIGMLGRTVGVAILGQFLANQTLNYITRGHPTWENEEEGFGAKVSAYIPDVIGDGPGFFLNPFVLPAEISHLLMEKTERSGDFTKAGKEFGMSRLGPIGRVVTTPFVREDEMGAKLRDSGEVLTQMGKAVIPVPLSAGAAYRAGKQVFTGEPEELYPGQFEKQAFQTFGIKMQTAPDAERRMGILAKEFNRHKGVKPSAEFFHGDFYFVDRAARIGNQRELKKELAKLLEKKTAADVQKHYRRWINDPFTGQATREMEFKKTLNDEQLRAYEAARVKRKQIVDRVLQHLRAGAE